MEKKDYFYTITGLKGKLLTGEVKPRSKSSSIDVRPRSNSSSIVIQVDSTNNDSINVRANLRTEFEGDLPYSGSMDASPKRKTSATLMAGETKTSVMRQELNSGKGGKSKWSWKEREDDMRELERKNLEQKREIQKLKKQNETIKGELDGVKERLAAEQTNEISNILASGQYLDSQGNKYIILEDDVAKQREDELTTLKTQIEQLEKDCNSFRDNLSSAEEQKNDLSSKLDTLITEKQKVDASIEQLMKEREGSDVEREEESQKIKLEFESVLKDLENKLQEKEKENFEAKNEKEKLLGELNEIVSAKKQLEYEMDSMNGVIQEQVQKIDELSTKIFGRDDDLKAKLDEVEKAREECKVLQESNNIVEKEQEMFMNGVLTKLDDIRRILHDVEYKKSHQIHDDDSCENDSNKHTNDKDNHNEESIIEELNLSNVSSDSIDTISPRSSTDVITRFEEVKNLLMQKIGDIDSVISSKDFQINKNVNQAEEWKTNCVKIEQEAKSMKEQFESLLEMKEKHNHELREQNEQIKNECNEKITALDKLQQENLAGMENSDAYYREHVESLKNEFEKKSKEQEAVIQEQTASFENLIQETNYLRNEVQSKGRELNEMSRKYELSISQVEEREKELREENETYLSEEIDRIQHDCKNKLKQLQDEKESTEMRITLEYEDKITELQLAYNKLKANEPDVMRKEYNHHVIDVAVQCDDIFYDDVNKSEIQEQILTQNAEYEEELQKIRDALTMKSREMELLQAKYDAQHRLVDFVTLSLEQERGKKNNSNEEILNILEKLEQKVNETFHCPNESNEYYASETSINSMMTESIPDTLYAANPLELNTTWPPKYNNLRATSPIRRWSSLGVIEQDQEKRKELIERLRAEISSQLNGMSTYPSSNGLGSIHTSPKSTYASKLPKPWSNIMDETDRGHHISMFESHGIPHMPSKYGKLSTSTPSIRATFMKNKISHDSGLDQNDDINELISFPNQLHNVIEMFKKLKEQHEQLKEDTSGSYDTKWSNDLENWKNRVQYKLNDLKPNQKAPSERSDSALSTISSSSILFHPNDNEVKAIIENANKMYDNAHFVL